jgi:hypothetical protein
MHKAMRNPVRAVALLRRVSRSEDGFTMVELMAAVLVTATAVIALVGSLDFSRDMTNASEVRQAAVHRAEREMEQLQALSFKQLAHSSSGGFGALGDLSSRVSQSGSDWLFKYDRGDTSKSEPLAVGAEGTVAAGPTAFDDGRFSGTVHRFVTWTNDETCAGLVSSPLCPNSRNYKRVTIVVTINGFNKTRPVWFSGIISDPDDGPLDAVTSPLTECKDNLGNVRECVNSLGDLVRSYFLTDTPASSDIRQLITASHATHPTLAAVGLCTPLISLGCPTPDLLSDEPPPLLTGGILPTLFKYSTDLVGGYLGGRILRRDTTCSGTPSTSDNTKGGFWATPQVPSRVLNGKGGATLYTHTVDNMTASGTVCIAVYDVPPSILNLIALPPTELGRVSYSLSNWPKQPTQISFPFTYRTSNYTVPANHRIGVRIWVSSASGSDLVIVYDHPSYPTYVELNSPGS